MDIQNRRALKAYAAGRLQEQSYSPRRLALIHTAVASAGLLIVTLLNYLLSRKVGATSGLSGIGMRSILQTIQMALQYVINIALPFWQIGFIFAAIRMARGEQAKPVSLSEGFRRFGPVLRLMLLRGLIYGGVAIACVYLSSVIFTFTPAAWKMMELLMPLVESEADMMQLQNALLEMPLDQIAGLIWPVFVIFGVLYGLICIALFYRFRLSEFLIMDRPGTGALAALTLSGRLTRKNRLRLLRLDLSFWWYYALQLLSALLCYLDVLLAYVVVDLPVDAGTASLLSYALGLGAQVLLFACAGSYVHTTQAAAYDVLLQQPVQAPQPKPAPKSLPWDDYKPQ